MEQKNIVKEKKKLATTNKTTLDYVYLILKRIIDIFGALIGILILIPATIIIYLVRVIKNEDKGPIFYEQLRYGKNGKIFRMYKFRTMVIGAHDILDDYLEKNCEAKKEFEEYKKLKNDPRITKLGGFLRKTSLDELPQFINILLGDMSFVGPRPVIKSEVEKYGDQADKFLSVTPGLTGYWQANGRSNTTYEERIKMELYYVDNISLILDIKILFKTIISVIKKEGAI